MAKYDIVKINSRLDFFPSGVSNYTTHAKMNVTQDEENRYITLTANATNESSSSGWVMVKTLSNPIPAEHFCLIMFEFEYPSTNVTGVPICWVGSTSDGTTVDGWHEPIPTSTASYDKDVMQGLCTIKGYTKQILQVGIGLKGATTGDYVKIRRVAIIDETEIFGAGNEHEIRWCLEHFTFNATLKSFSFAEGCLERGDIIECPYSGAAQNTRLPMGKYRLECWGAQGGSYDSNWQGGYGGYARGNLTLDETTVLYLYAGGQPVATTSSRTQTPGGFNGGGKGYNIYYSSTYTYGQGGGGGSDIRIGTDSLYARVIAAGGGGGSASQKDTIAKCGGGNRGECLVTEYRATQTSGGTTGNKGSFGQGGSSSTTSNYKYGSGGGGRRLVWRSC